MGINTQKKDPNYFNALKEIDYQYIEIAFGVSNADQEQKLIENLQATGMVIEAKPEGTNCKNITIIRSLYTIMVFTFIKFLESDPDADVQSDSNIMCKMYSFAVRDEPGALAKALLIFNVCM